MPDTGKRWGAYVTVVQRNGSGQRRAAPYARANESRKRPKARM